MTTDPSRDSMSGKKRRLQRAGAGKDISPDLREQIIGAAHKIRVAHEVELSDRRKADRAGRLFWNVVCDKETAVAPIQELRPNFALDMERLADGLGHLVSGVIRTGTGLLTPPVTVLAEAFMAGVAASASRTIADPGHDEPPAPPPTPEEVVLIAALRHHIPLLTTAVRQGADGYAFAATVIRLGGRSVHDQLSGLGADRIIQLIKGEPDLWAQVAPMEDSFLKFLKEFVDYKGSTAPPVD
jgi:hypothetical protein